MYHRIDTSAVYESFLLKKIRAGLEYRKDLIGINVTDIEIWSDMTTNEIIYKLEMFVYGELIDEVGVSYPKDWWQAIKERFAPKWFLSKYPVEHKNIVLTAEAVYPKLSLPNAEPVVRLSKT